MREQYVFWGMYRHCIPIENAVKLWEFIETGQLDLRTGVLDVSRSGYGFAVTRALPGAGAGSTISTTSSMRPEPDLTSPRRIRPCFGTCSDRAARRHTRRAAGSNSRPRQGGGTHRQVAEKPPSTNSVWPVR